jgi:16S rRNA (cytidine1402-2'-O)-methyltransferase
MAGKLYVVGTPIGNLNDFSPRQRQTLEEVDFIAAEDTRVTVKLLNHFAIKKPLVSYYEHNLRERGEQIVARIEAGENCAVVSDAGMPCISDPGEDLVRLCAERGIETVVVPGPSAAIAALCVSGLVTSRFCFEGFLSTAKKSRRERLEQLREEERTMIFYEAPHKLLNTLKDFLEAFGERKITLARELTKIHEEVLRFSALSEAVEYFTATPPRGEFVLVLEGAAPREAGGGVTLEEAVERAVRLVKNGERPAEAAKLAAKNTPYKKSEIYAELIKSGG